jgi:hypothetical protein
MTELAGAVPPARYRGRTTLGLVSVLITGLAVASGASIAHAASASPASWTHPKAVPSAKTGAPPSTIVDDNVLYTFWTGESGNPGIWYSGYNGTTWTHPTKVPAAVPSQNVGEALALYEGGLYVFYVSQSSGVWYTVLSGTTWSAPATVPGSVTSADRASELAADVYLGYIYLAWPGKTPARDISYAAFNGTKWTAAHKVPKGANGNPAFALYLGDLYLSWWSCAGCQIHYQTFNGTTWTNPATFTSAASGGPGLAVFLGDLDDAWIAASGGAVTVTPYNGTSWLTPATIPSSSSHVGCAGVSLVVYHAALVAVWGPVGACGGKIDYAAGP